MSGDQQRPATGLFNNSLLSDVKLKQVSSDGQVREYYAHKAVLSADSRYFYKAFTGNFREASEAEMTIHDDDPEHFEFLLKFMYTHNYDTAKIEQLAGGDPVQRVTIPCEIHALANTYDMPLLSGPTVDDIKELLADKTSKTLNLLKALIPVYYKSVPSANGPLSDIIATKTRTDFLDFFISEDYRTERNYTRTYVTLASFRALWVYRKWLQTVRRRAIAGAVAVFWYIIRTQTETRIWLQQSHFWCNG